MVCIVLSSMKPSVNVKAGTYLTRAYVVLLYFNFPTNNPHQNTISYVILLFLISVKPWNQYNSLLFLRLDCLCWPKRNPMKARSGHIPRLLAHRLSVLLPVPKFIWLKSLCLMLFINWLQDSRWTYLGTLVPRTEIELRLDDFGLDFFQVLTQSPYFWETDLYTHFFYSFVRIIFLYG